MWKIFVKAGVEGWKSLIPIYNLIVMYKIVGLSPYLLFISLIPIIVIIGFFVMAIFAAISMISESLFAALTIGFMFILFFSILGVSLLLNILYSVRLAKAFNKEAAFIVGLIFIPVVFNGILAFDKKIKYKLNEANTENP